MALLSIFLLTISALANNDALREFEVRALTAAGETEVSAEILSRKDNPVTKLAHAMESLKKMPALASPDAKLRQNLLGENPYAYFAARVKRIVIDLDLKGNCQMAGIVAYVQDKKSATIYLCPFAVKLSDVALQSNLIHEARHLLGPGDEDILNQPVAHPHKLCDFGTAKGLDACDDHFDGGGSYAIQTEFLLRVSRTEGIPLEARNEAKGYALSYVLEHFNRLPFPLTEGLLLRRGADVFHLSESGALTPLLRDLPPYALVSLRGTPVVMDPMAGSANSFAGVGTFATTPGSFAAHYRGLSQAERARILDVYFGGHRACLLYLESLYCEVGEETVRIDFPEGFRPRGFSILSLFGDDMVFVTNDQGDNRALPWKKTLAEWKFADLAPNATFNGFTSFAMIAGRGNYGLKNGQLVSFRAGVSTPVAALEKERFEKIIGIFRWAPELNDL